MRQPLIGITTSVHIDPHGERRYRSYAPNAKAIENAGGLPVLIPADLDDMTLRAIYDRLDAVLLPGGGDISPDCYSAPHHPLTTNIDHWRDHCEITIARWAVEDDVPLLGICRGHQVLNVALGGTLVQDIPSLVETTLTHDTGNTIPRYITVHPVTIAPDSRLSSILGQSEVRVNSLHHQSVELPAPGLRVIAHAPDGVVEASEFPGRRFVMSVQWHPEDLATASNNDAASLENTEQAAMKCLFDAFVSVARESAKQ